MCLGSGQQPVSPEALQELLRRSSGLFGTVHPLVLVVKTTGRLDEVAEEIWRKRRTRVLTAPRFHDGYLLVSMVELEKNAAGLGS